uniref:outer membrane beta-barrel protein n=1 Tax=Cellvibrio fontiphilus TaxID=1815559 RepID=UPI002B4C1C7C|nr:outer membrane beta-barrel protein [Cellvibrio fontiphilus]
MRALLTAGLLTLPMTTWAVNTEPAGFYAGVGVSQIDYSGKLPLSLTEKPDWTAVELSGGYKHSPFVGVESRLGFAGSPELLYGGVYYRTESANDTAKTYLLLGVAGASIEANAGDDLSLSGFSYGAGVGFPVGRNINFNLEYRMLVDDSDADVNMGAFGLSLDYRFSGVSTSGGSGQTAFVPATDAGFYAGLAVAQIELSEDEANEEDEFEEEFEDEEAEGSPDLKWNAVELIGGYRYNSLATAEARFGVSDKDELVSFTYASLYYRPSIELSQVELYGLLGYTRLESTFEDEPDEETGEVDKESYTFSSLSYGAGARLLIGEQWSVGLEYRLLVSDKDEGDTTDLTALAANVHYRF